MITYFKGSSVPMTSTNHILVNALTVFTDNFIEKHQIAHKHLPLVTNDDLGPSVCIKEIFDERQSCWKPSKVETKLSFENIEQALEIEIHPDINTYFTTFYSESIDAECIEGKLSLLFAWNEEDFHRLQENLIGHIMMKQKLKQEITLFFAVTDEDDMIISLMNNTGEVWVEQVGCKPHKKLANSLSDFIQQITPNIHGN